MISQFLKSCAVAAALCVSACATGAPPAGGVREIVSTTSFGMCVGYCSTRLEISEGQAVLIRHAGDGRGQGALPDQRLTQTLSESEWADFVRLADAADLAGLPPVIGCPDCADGGAESLTIAREGAQQSVSFDFGGAVEQAQPLLDRLRALRERMTPP